MPVYSIIGASLSERGARLFFRPCRAQLHTQETPPLPASPQRAVQAGAVQGCGKGCQGMLPCTCLKPAGMCGGRGRLCPVHKPALETVRCCGLVGLRCSIYCALSCVPAGTLETPHRNKLFTYRNWGDIRISKHSPQRTTQQSTLPTTTCLRLQE